jgi:hypothetical protein
MGVIYSPYSKVFGGILNVLGNLNARSLYGSKLVQNFEKKN